VPLAENIADAILNDLTSRGCVVLNSGSDDVPESLAADWAAIIDRHIREATGVK
jgi:hypothetical protein